MKNLINLLCILGLSLAAAGCGPTVEEYSDALRGTWTTPIEDSEDGVIEQGIVSLTFSPIPEGSEISKIKVFYRGHLDGSSSYGYTADFTVAVNGTYSIVDPESEYPLDMRWNVNSLEVNVSNITLSNVVNDFHASLEEITSAAFGINGGTRSAIKKELTKQIKSLCRQRLIDRNNETGYYGLDFEEDSFFLILTDGSYQFTRSKGTVNESD